MASTSVSAPAPTSSPRRPQTPYIPARRAELLDEDGALTTELEDALAQIYLKYATTSASSAGADAKGKKVVREAIAESCLDDDGLEGWARDTNGKPLPADQIEEMKTFLDTTPAGHLTWSGFIQLYQLQTENDPEETWADLKTHGYDDSLKLVATRKEEEEEAEGQLDSPSKKQSEKAKEEAQTGSQSVEEGGQAEEVEKVLKDEEVAKEAGV